MCGRNRRACPLLTRCRCNCLSRPPGQGEQGTRAKKDTAKQGAERRRPMPIANSTVNHTPAHSQITQPSTHSKQGRGRGRGRGQTDGAGAALRDGIIILSRYLAYTRTVTVQSTCCRSTGHRAQWPFCLETQASKAVCACALVRVHRHPKCGIFLTLTLPICRHTPPSIRWFKVGRGRGRGQRATAQNMPWRLFSLSGVIVRRLWAMNGQAQREGQPTQN